MFVSFVLIRLFHKASVPQLMVWYCGKQAQTSRYGFKNVWFSCVFFPLYQNGNKELYLKIFYYVNWCLQIFNDFLEETKMLNDK